MLIVPLLKIFPFLAMPNDNPVAENTNVTQVATEAYKKCIAKVLLNGGSSSFVARLESLLAVKRKVFRLLIDYISSAYQNVDSNRTVASEDLGVYNSITDDKERCLATVKAQGASANFLARLEKLLHNKTPHVLGSTRVMNERAQ